MKIPQENSLYGYLYLNLAKITCYSFSLFSSVKWENKRVEQVLPRRRVGTSGRGEVAGKGG
jgi:hypothetical protein